MKNRWLCLMLGVAGLIAAPLGPSVLLSDDVASQGELARKELEDLWGDLYGDEPAATNAAIKLFKNAEVAVPFLKEKLEPLKLDAERCRQLLDDLGDQDEAVWKPAWEKLDYLDPRLAFELQTLMNEVSDGPARTRMVELCSDRPADSLIGQQIELRGVGNDGYNFSSKGSWWAEHRVDRLGTRLFLPKRSWRRAARCVAILEQIGTQDAVIVLLKLASGHPDAFPTKAAKDSVLRLKK